MNKKLMDFVIIFFNDSLLDTSIRFSGYNNLEINTPEDDLILIKLKGDIIEIIEYLPAETIKYKLNIKEHRTHQEIFNKPL